MYQTVRIGLTLLLLTPLPFLFQGATVASTTIDNNKLIIENQNLRERLKVSNDSLSNDAIYERNSLAKLNSQLEYEKIRYNILQQAIHEKEQQFSFVYKKHALDNYWYLSVIAVLIVVLAYLQLSHRKTLKTNIKNIEIGCKKEYVRQLSVEKIRITLETLEAERERISRNLHDGISNNLVSIGLHLRTIDDSQPMKALLCRFLDDTHREIRAIMHNLSSPSLNSISFEHLFRYHIELMNIHANQRVDGALLPNTGWSDLNPKLQTDIFRLVQEVTGNITKHSRATRVTVTLRRDDDTITLVAEDDGIGLVADQISMGFGMKNLKTRVEYLSGEIQVNSSPMKGTVVAIHIPANFREYSQLEKHMTTT